MRYLYKVGLLFLILSLSSSVVFNEELIFKNFNSADGLSQHDVNCIIHSKFCRCTVCALNMRSLNGSSNSALISSFAQSCRNNPREAEACRAAESECSVIADVAAVLVLLIKKPYSKMIAATKLHRYGFTRLCQPDIIVR